MVRGDSCYIIIKDDRYGYTPGSIVKAVFVWKTLNTSVESVTMVKLRSLHHEPVVSTCDYYGGFRVLSEMEVLSYFSDPNRNIIEPDYSEVYI